MDRRADDWPFGDLFSIFSEASVSMTVSQRHTVGGSNQIISSGKLWKLKMYQSLKFIAQRDQMRRETQFQVFLSNSRNGDV